KKGNIVRSLVMTTLEPKSGGQHLRNGVNIPGICTFVSDIIRSAKISIILIDNYVDDTVLTLLGKREQSVTAKIYTKNINNQLQLDLQRYSSQYPAIEIELFSDAHDRFLIIDDTELYHIGASLKDLGKKWFAFSRMDVEVVRMLSLLHNSN
ncbi:hypothetical protein ACR78C_21610, partial [Sphingobacterium spiritivorum]